MPPEQKKFYYCWTYVANFSFGEITATSAKDAAEQIDSWFPDPKFKEKGTIRIWSNEPDFIRHREDGKLY